MNKTKLLFSNLFYQNVIDFSLLSLNVIVANNVRVYKSQNNKNEKNRSQFWYNKLKTKDVLWATGNNQMHS